jgi:hypothetical protein
LAVITAKESTMSRTTWRDTAGMWGPAAFATASVLAGWRQPGYDHRRFHVSGLAAHQTRSAPVMVPGFLALGLSSLVMPASRSTRPLLRMAGVGTVLAGVFRCSNVQCPDPASDPDATREDAVHAAASIGTFLVWTALPFVDAVTSRSTAARVNKAVLGVVVAAGLVAAGATARSDHPQKGVAQRVFLSSVFVWYGSTAIASARARCSSGRAQSRI